MIPPHNLEHAEAEAFTQYVKHVVSMNYVGQARVQTSALLDAHEQLFLAVRIAPVFPGKGPKLCMSVRLVMGEEEGPPESWKES